MIVITSAAYVGMEFRAEVGKIPPVMLPVGNKRLLDHQVAVLKDRFPNERIYLSLPEGYLLSKKDKLNISKYKIKIVSVPVGISLGDSVLYVINSIGEYDNVIRLLHGDTLIYDMPLEGNIISVSKTSDDYNWEVENRTLSEETVWSGYFSFNSPKSLIRLLTTSKGSFVDAVRMYHDLNKMNVTEVSEWLDFGHVNSYFKSRSKIYTHRYFNYMKVENGKVLKSSHNVEKISAERLWFESIPEAVRFYTPQIIGHGNLSSENIYYELEYLSCLPLNEIFVHAVNPPFYWLKIFKHLEKFLKNNVDCSIQLINNKNSKTLIKTANLLVVDKTKKRVNEYIEQSSKDFNIPTKLNGVDLPSLNDVIDDCISKIDDKSHVFGVLHGDLCFSNILYDTRSDRIKVIDPRGIDAEGNFSYLGDLRYDLAKINHSVIGLYDHIVSGAYNLTESNDLNFEFEIFIDERISKIQKIYIENMKLSDLTPLNLIPETILLFLSMLPLHKDSLDRQNAFIANSLRLYQEYIVN